MTSYTRTQLEALAAQQGTSIDTSRNHHSLDTFRPPPAPRDVRRAIFDAVCAAGEPISRAQIANALNLKKSPWLCQHIERLVDEGYLTRLLALAPNGIAPMFYYDVAR